MHATACRRMCSCEVWQQKKKKSAPQYVRLMSSFGAKIRVQKKFLAFSATCGRGGRQSAEAAQKRCAQVDAGAGVGRGALLRSGCAHTAQVRARPKLQAIMHAPLPPLQMPSRSATCRLRPLRAIRAPHWPGGIWRAHAGHCSGHCRRRTHFCCCCTLTPVARRVRAVLECAALGAAGGCGCGGQRTQCKPAGAASHARMKLAQHYYINKLKNE